MEDSVVLTLQQLARSLDGEWYGNPNIQIKGVASLLRATSTDVAYYDNPVFYSLLQETRAAVVILTRHQLHSCPGNAIVVSDPNYAMSKAAKILNAEPPSIKGIHPSSQISQTLKAGAHLSVGANAIVEEDVILGDNVTIGANSVIETNVVIGNGSYIGNHVYIHQGSRIGNQVKIEPGSIIGAAPFNYAKKEGEWYAGPAVGGVIIQDEVEVGANTVIDRGGLSETFIAKGVCIDNLVHISHDVCIGAHTAIAANAVIGANVQIDSDCVLGGSCCIAPTVKLCADVVITGMSTVSKSICKPGIYSSGTLAGDHRQWRKNAARFRRLDDYIQRLNRLEKNHLRDKK